jgi:TP901 family phage tail tape measure protein
MGGLLSFASVTGALAVLGSQFKKCIDNAKEFESSLSHLKATFNLSADAMDKLSNSAMATGRATAKSASDIANAYMMVGSKIPTLKQQPEALDYVTKSAITLSKAGLIPLEDATNILSTSLNTMGLKVESTD